jgi:predicted  nucleic acid-binding Zn-ribbon protein
MLSAMKALLTTIHTCLMQMVVRWAARYEARQQEQARQKMYDELAPVRDRVARVQEFEELVHRNEKVNALDNRVEQVVANVDDLNSSFEALKTRVHALEKQNNFMKLYILLLVFFIVFVGNLAADYAIFKCK